MTTAKNVLMAPFNTAGPIFLTASAALTLRVPFCSKYECPVILLADVHCCDYYIFNKISFSFYCKHGNCFFLIYLKK